MAAAGRILIMPKGDYKEESQYELLDLVKHNGTSWIAKKASIGIEPSEANSEYWQNMFEAEAFVDARIEAKVKEYMENNTETSKQ